MQFQTCIWCGNEASVILTSLRAFSNFGLLSSTLSLDCCFNFRSIAVTEKKQGGGEKKISIRSFANVRQGDGQVHPKSLRMRSSF